MGPLPAAQPCTCLTRVLHARGGAEHAKKFAEHRSNHYKLQGGQSLAELRKLAAAAMDEEDEDEDEEK